MALEGLPEVVPHPGLRNPVCVDRNQIRDLISASNFAQIPNPCSASQGDLDPPWTSTSAPPPRISAEITGHVWKKRKKQISKHRTNRYTSSGGAQRQAQPMVVPLLVLLCLFCVFVMLKFS
jgi:hypothetical protein